MQTILVFLFAPFAVYRIARMLASEEGPFSIFDKWRNLFIQPNWIGRGMRCPLCISFWAGLFLAALLFWFPSEIIEVGVVGIGFSGAASFLYLLERRQ